MVYLIEFFILFFFTYFSLINMSKSGVLGCQTGWGLFILMGQVISVPLSDLCASNITTQTVRGACWVCSVSLHFLPLGTNLHTSSHEYFTKSMNISGLM